MSTFICPHCSAETPDEYNFCIACDKQVKCLNSMCNKKLIAGKTFCFGCGQPLVTINLPQSQPNMYVRDITQKGKNYEEHVEFSVSDHAVSELAPFIVGQMISSSPRRTHESSRIETSPVPHKSLNASPIAPEGEEAAPASESEQAVEPEQIRTPTSAASRYFERDGEFLVPTEKDFRGKTWADQQKHFVLLYTSAYFDIFQKPVPSTEHLKVASEKAKVYDASNFTKHLKKVVSEQLSELSEGLKLNDRGSREVVKILSLMADEKSPIGCDYWSRTTNSNHKRHRLSKDDKDRLHEWTIEEVQLGNLNIRDIKSPRDYAMVALWIITVNLKKANSIRWNEAYQFFKEKFQTMTASPEAFSYAMRNELNAKYFRQSDEMFFLSSEGVKQVEEWVGGQPVASSGEEESEVA